MANSTFFSSVEMEALFTEIFGPPLAGRGFSGLSKNRWVRDTEQGFKHVFYVYPFRPAADYYPYGALSLDYVPRIERGKVRLRPQPKFVRNHLTSEFPALYEPWRISRDANCAREQAVAVAASAIEPIERWLEKFRSLNDVLSAFERRAERERGNFYHYPETALSYAFTLAKAGLLERAEVELERVLQSSYFKPETHATIKNYLQQTRS